MVADYRILAALPCLFAASIAREYRNCNKAAGLSLAGVSVVAASFPLLNQAWHGCPVGRRSNSPAADISEVRPPIQSYRKVANQPSEFACLSKLLSIPVMAIA